MVNWHSFLVVNWLTLLLGGQLVNTASWWSIAQLLGGPLLLGGQLAQLLGGQLVNTASWWSIG